MNKPKIQKVWIEKLTDDSPDLSYLGVYTDKAEDYCIVRVGEYYGEFISDLPEEAEEPSRGREYRYFLPTNHVPHNPKEWSHVSEEVKAEVVKTHGSLENADKYYAKQSFKRMESYENNDWCMIGIIAKAEVLMPSGNIQTFSSSGLWGIESDSDKEYEKSVIKEELATLKKDLEEFGFNKKDIDKAFDSADCVIN